MITETETRRRTRALAGAVRSTIITASALAVAIIIGPLGQPPSHDTSDPAVDRVASPTITYLTEPTPDDRAIIDWAVDRYLQAGLQLPDLEVAFPVHCNGKAGRYFVGQGRIELCKTSRKLVLHELAHAWDDANDLDRAHFMARRGLDHWYEHECRSKHESGGEQLAHLVTWGLMDIDIRHRTEMFAGQPIEDRPRRLMHLEDADLSELIALYTELTGVPPMVSWWAPTDPTWAGPR